MLQSFEVIVEPGGVIRPLEQIEVAAPTPAVLTVLRPVAKSARVATPKASLEKLAEISRRCAALPVLDDRSPDEILGYADDPLGLPG